MDKISHLIQVVQRPLPPQPPPPKDESGAKIDSGIIIKKFDDPKDYSLETIINLFTSGNLAVADLLELLTQKSITPIVTTKGDLTTVIFKNKKKLYKISCNTEAAKSGTDDIMVNTYTADELKKEYGLSAKLISQYFDIVEQEVLTVKKYAFKGGNGFKRIEDLVNAYRNDLILDNFLDGAIKDGRSLSAIDGEEFDSVSDLNTYADRIKLATGEEAEKLKQKALDKFIQDFSSNDLPVKYVEQILNAIGIEPQIDVKNKLTTVTFQYNNKTYNIACNTIFANGLKSLEDFEEIIKNNDFDLTNYDIGEYEDMYLDFIKADIKEKYNYSDDYIDLMLEFSKTRTNWNGSLQEYLTCFGEIYKELLETPDIHGYSDGFFGEYDIFSSEGGIEYTNMPWAISVCISNARGNNMQTQFFAYIFNNALQGLTETERIGFYHRLAQTLDVEKTTWDEYTFKISDFEKLNENNDKSWFDELYTLANQITKTIKHIPEEEIENATSINPDIIFKDTDKITAEYLLNNLPDLLISDDAGARKFAKFIKDKSWLTKFQQDNNAFRFDYEQVLSGIIYKLNELTGIENTQPPTISPNLLNYFKTAELFGDKSFNIFNVSAEILNSDEKLIDSIIVANIDSNIDEVDQGGTGDCWLLSGIRALVSTEAGKNKVHNAIQWSKDKKSVWVYFEGREQYVQVTLDDIKESFKKKDTDGVRAYSQGDLDVLVLELAMEKIMGGYSKLEGDSSRTFWNEFLGTADNDWDMGMGLDDIGNAIWGFITGKGGRQDMSSDDIYKYINKLYEAQQQGLNVAATCWLYSFNDSYYPFTDVDGKQQTLEELGAGDVFNTGSGHEFAITNITATTVTFVNPHDSKNEVYTVSWDEFAHLGFGGMESAIFKPLKDNEILHKYKSDNIIYSIDNTGKITTNTPVANYNVPIIRNVSCDINNTDSISSMLGGVEIAIKNKLNTIKNAISGYDEVKLQQAYDTTLSYYYNLLSNVFLTRSSYPDRLGGFPHPLQLPDGTSQTFAYKDYTQGGKYVSSSDGIDIDKISDLDYNLKLPYGYNAIKTNNSSGIFVNEDGDKFDIYINLETMVNKFMSFLN